MLLNLQSKWYSNTKSLFCYCPCLTPVCRWEIPALHAMWSDPAIRQTLVFAKSIIYYDTAYPKSMGPQGLLKNAPGQPVHLHFAQVQIHDFLTGALPPLWPLGIACFFCPWMYVVVAYVNSVALTGLWPVFNFFVLGCFSTYFSWYNDTFKHPK